MYSRARGSTDSFFVKTTQFTANKRQTVEWTRWIDGVPKRYTIQTLPNSINVFSENPNHTDDNDIDHSTTLSGIDSRRASACIYKLNSTDGHGKNLLPDRFGKLVRIRRYSNEFFYDCARVSKSRKNLLGLGRISRIDVSRFVMLT